MRSGVITKKIGTTQMFDDRGQLVQVTLLKMDPNFIIDSQKIGEKSFLKIASIDQKSQRLSSSLRGVFKKASVEPKKEIKQFSVTEDNLISVGEKIEVNYFQIGAYIDVSGTSKGKGFAGAMKRHNFRGLEATHGVSISHRSHGSTGQCQDPGKVFKGKKMAGHMGNKKVTKQNLKIIDSDMDNGILVVSGSVPGSKNSIVIVRDAVKKTKFLR